MPTIKLNASFDVTFHLAQEALDEIVSEQREVLAAVNAGQISCTPLEKRSAEMLLEAADKGNDALIEFMGKSYIRNATNAFLKSNIQGKDDWASVKTSPTKIAINGVKKSVNVNQPYEG